MVLEAFGHALQSFGSAELWLFIVIGVILGLVFGIIPGVSNILGMALILPFVFTMTEWQVLPLMAAMMSVGFMGGSITAILLNIPGTAPNAATLIDGFPMSQKGEAGRALGAALTASGVGSIFSAFIALAMVPLVLPMVMALRSADMVFIILLGLSFIGILGSGSMIKGLVSGGLGIMFSFIGLDLVRAFPRFCFDSIYLFDGIPFVPVALGIFAIPEMIALGAKGGSIAQAGVVIKGAQDVLRGIKDVFNHWWLCLRSSAIGYIVGLIPGIGAITAVFVAYGHAKYTSKHPETFGTGNVEGVIAPESANDSKEAGSLLTTLALGIPGSAVMAIFLGAILMVGLFPGPEMLTKHLDLSLTLMLIIIVASVMGALFCLPLAPYMSKIAFTPGRFLVPLVMVIVFVGTFTYQELFNDLVVLIIFTALGLALRKYGFNRPTLFIGYILGHHFEEYLFIALRVAGPVFFMRPISLVLIIINIALFVFGPMKRVFQRRRGVVRNTDNH